MTVLITLVIPPGGDVNNFSLYSDATGYSIPFATNISAAVLTAGYTTSAVPNGTTIIRATSTGLCTDFIDITVTLLPPPTTTTTSTTVITPYRCILVNGCDGVTSSTIPYNSSYSLGQIYQYTIDSNPGTIVCGTITNLNFTSIANSTFYNPSGGFPVIVPAPGCTNTLYCDIPLTTTTTSSSSTSTSTTTSTTTIPTVRCYEITLCNSGPVKYAVWDGTVYSPFSVLYFTDGSCGSVTNNNVTAVPNIVILGITNPSLGCADSDNCII